MEAGESHLHLRLHTPDARDTPCGRPVGDILEQRRLADPGLAAEHEHRALPAPYTLELAIQQLAFPAATMQHLT